MATSRSRIVRFAWASASALLVAGCATSPAIHFHTLMPAEQSTKRTSPAGFLIDVRPVGLPAAVDRESIVMRSGNSVSVAEYERWPAPLADELRSAMSARLTHVLSTDDVGDHPLSSESPIVRIRIDVRRFDAELADHVALDTAWTLRTTPDDRSALVCSSEQRVTVGSGYDGLVEGYQAMLDRLSADIVLSVRRFMERSSHPCPDS